MAPPLGAVDALRFLAADKAALPLIFANYNEPTTTVTIIKCNNTLFLYYFRIFIGIES